MMNHSLKTMYIVTLVCVLFGLCVHESRAQVRTIDTIALSTDSGLSSGDPVIGVGGNVAVDSFGKVMFFVTTERDNDTSTREFFVATSNGTATSVLQDFNFLNIQKPKPILNATGTIAYSWFDGVNETSKNGIYIGSNVSGLAFVDAKVVAPPDDPDVKFVSAGRPVLNQSGFVVFAAGGDVFFGRSSGRFTEIASGAGSPLINARGDVVVSTQKKISFYSNQAGQLQTVVESGVTILPGLDNGNDFNITGEGIAIGPNGEVLFEAVFSPPGLVPRRRMWRWTSPNTFEPLFDTIKPGSLGFDVDTQVKKDEFFITDAGDLIYFSENHTNVSDRVRGAIWKETGDSLEVIAHAGIGADGPGSIAPGIGVPFVGFSDLTANGAGMVAFIGRFDIVDQNVHGRGLWAQDSEGVLQLVALDGGELMTRDGMKTIGNALILSGQSNVSGFSSSYNNKFELAFIAVFDEGISGIFLATLGDVVPTDGNAYFWNRGCGDDNWHTICAGMTNWLDAENLPHMMPPGASGDENVTIAMNSDIGVTLDQEDAQIGKLTAIGKLIVRTSLTLNEPSTVESLVFDSLDSQVIVNDELTLTGDETVFQAGTVTINGDGGIVNEGTVTVEPFPFAAIAKSNQVRSQTQPPPTLTIDGDKVWLNRNLAKFQQKSDILVKDHAGKTAILNGKDSEWNIEKGSLLVGSAGEAPTFINVGQLTKKSSDPPDESFIDLAFDQKSDGTVVVEGGTLTFRGGGSFDATVDEKDPEILLTGEMPTLRLSAQSNVNRTLYRVLSGALRLGAITVAILPVFVIDNGAVLSILQGATFRTDLRASFDRTRGGFELNGGEIAVAGIFQNDQDFTWRAGTITTPTPSEGDLLVSNIFLNISSMSVEGIKRKTLSGLLVNEGGLSLKTRSTGSSTLTIDGGTLINIKTLSMTEDSVLMSGATEGLVRNVFGGTIFVVPSRTAMPSTTATIATKLDNHGKVFVNTLLGNNKITLKLTGSIVQLEGTTLTGGEWATSGGTLDFNGKVINQLGESTGEQAIISLENGGTFPALQLKTIEKTGTVRLGSGQSLVFPGELTNRGGLQVGGIRGGFPLIQSSITINGKLDNFGSLAVGLGNRLEVRNGTMFLQDGSTTRINGTVAIFQDNANDLRMFPGSVLKGKGTINGAKIIQINASAMNQGKSVIGPGTSPGILTFNGDFEQTAGGALEIEIGGTEVGMNQDQLVINGNADIGGTLVLKFIDDFSPQAGQTFDFLSVSGTQTGDFESVEIVDLAEGFEFEVSPTDTGFMMTALSDGVFTGISGEINEVNKGFNTPEAETVAESGDTNVPMLQFEIVPEGDGLSIFSLALSASGSGGDALDLTNVTVWVDEDDNGLVNLPLTDADFDLDEMVDGNDGLIAVGDLQIGNGVYDADNGTLNLTIDPPLELAARETVHLLIAYDIAEAEADVATVVSGIAEVTNNKTLAPSSRFSFGLATIMFPLVLGLGFVAVRKPKVSAWCGLSLVMMVWVTGCPMGGLTPGPVPNNDPAPVTFKVTLTAIDAEEAGTGIDASVDNLFLVSTTLTVLR